MTRLHASPHAAEAARHILLGLALAAALLWWLDAWGGQCEP